MPSFFERHSTTIINVTSILAAFAVMVAFIDQRFDAQAQRILGSAADVNQPFNAQETCVNQQLFNAQNKYMSQLFNAQNKYTNRRIDALEADVAALRRLVSGISRARLTP